MAEKTAIERRAQKKKEPMALVHEGLALLDDPSLPLDYETRMAAALPLLVTKHFVMGMPHGPRDESIPHGAVTDGDADQGGAS